MKKKTKQTKDLHEGVVVVEMDTNMSSSSIGTSLSSDGFQTDSGISTTSTPRKSVSVRSVNINSEDREDLRITLARKRKSDTVDKDSNDRISFLSHRIKEKQETISEIERISKKKIAGIELEIAADKSEIERISNRVQKTYPS